MNKNDIERGIIRVTPEVVTPKGIARRHSTGKVVSKAPVSLLGCEEKILPHYLRASAASCHDFCKYGRKDESENKGKYHVRPKFSENKVVPDKEEGSARTFNIERRKKTASKQRTTSNSKLKPSDGTKTLARKLPTLTGSIVSVEYDENKKQNSLPSFSNTESSELFDAVQRNVASYAEEIVSFEEVQTDQNFPPVQKNESSENGQDHALSGESETTNLSSPHENDLLQHHETIKGGTPFGSKVGSANQAMSEKTHETIYQLQTFLSSSTNDGLPDQLETNKPVTLPICKAMSTKNSETMKENALSARKIVPSSKPKVKKESLSVSRKAVSSAKLKVNMEKTATRKLDVTSKFAASMNSAASAVKRAASAENLKPQNTLSRSPVNVSSIPTRKANGKSKVVKRGIPPKIEEKKVVCPPRLSSHKPPTERRPSLKLRNRRDTKSFSITKNQQKSGKVKASDDNVKEKTLYVIDLAEESVNSNSMQPRNSNGRRSPPLMASLSSSSLSITSVNGEQEDFNNSGTDYTGESGSSMDNEIDDDHVELLNDDGEKKMLRRAAKIHPQEKDVEAHKVKFKRGKVVDLQFENNGPRRLRFRHGRVLGENRNGKGEVHKRSFRKKKDMNSNGLNPEPTEIVMLRHQYVQDRKDAQGLFNEVIEVTANKLVETRKSKVKALVGAFETVISLQESKPASMV